MHDLTRTWQPKTLGSLASISYGHTTKANPNPVGPKFLRITDIQNGQVNWETVPFCSISPQDHFQNLLQHGDIVFARTGATTGKSFLLQSPPDAIVASYLIRVRITSPHISSSFLSYFFQTPQYWEAIAAGTSGSAQGGFNATKLSELKIPVPPIPEQERIVALLDETFLGIDQAKANARRNLGNARDLFQSVVHQAFSRSADNTSTLTAVSENLDSKRIPITKSKRSPGPFPYYGASGIVDYVSDFIFQDDLLLVSEDGANLLARTYPIAFSVTGKIWVNNHAHVLRFQNIVEQKYTEFYLNSISLAPYVSGMAQPKLNQAALNSIPIPWPPINQKQNIVEMLDSLSTETQRLEAVHQRELNALEELKQSILSQAFTPPN